MSALCFLVLSIRHIGDAAYLATPAETSPMAGVMPIHPSCLYVPNSRDTVRKLISLPYQ